MKKQSIVIFGAGKIGRSFIGQLFSFGGYEVIFVDINQTVISCLNKKREYKIVIKSDEDDRIIIVRNVRGINIAENQRVIEAIAKADIVAASVGKVALGKILPLLAESITERYSRHPFSPINIILSENMRDADVFVKTGLSELLPANIPFSEYVGLVETSIGKMVPMMPGDLERKDPLLVYAEPYNTLILSKNGFKGYVPEIEGLSFKENMKAWVDRKLFIHNFGHAAVAYLGHKYHPSAVCLWEVLSDVGLYKLVRKCMKQSAMALMHEHPGEFSTEDLDDHIDDLLHRFQNKALGDTIFRVGCDLYRKLGPHDRVVTVIKAAIKHNLPFDLLISTLLAAIDFRAKDENNRFFENDYQFFSEVKKGLRHVLKDICQFTPEEMVLITQKMGHD